MLDAKLSGAVCTAFEVWAELLGEGHPKESRLFDALVDMHLALLDMNDALSPYNDPNEHEAIAHPLEVLQCAVNAAWDRYARDVDDGAYERFAEAIDNAEIACEVACADEYFDYLLERTRDDLGLVNDALGLNFDIDEDDLDSIALAMGEEYAEDVTNVYAQWVGEKLWGLDGLGLTFVPAMPENVLAAIFDEHIDTGGRVISVRYG